MTEAAAPQSSSGDIRVRIFGRTDVGRVREHNEDSFTIADLTKKSRSLREEDRVQTIGERGTLQNLASLSAAATVFGGVASFLGPPLTGAAMDAAGPLAFPVAIAVMAGVVLVAATFGGRRAPAA